MPFAKKKGGFVRVGGMFKSEEQYLPEGAQFSYSTTCDGKYLQPVAEMIAQAFDAGTPVKFSLTKWGDQDKPVLSISQVKPKAPLASKRIGREAGPQQPSQDIGL